MLSLYQVKGIGEVYTPTPFREIAPVNAPLKLFTGEAAGQLNRVFNQLQRGGVAILSGDRRRIVEAMQYIERKRNELYGRLENRLYSLSSSDGRRELKQSADPLLRVMCWANAAGELQVDPPPNLPYLLNLVGEADGANAGRPFLVPLITLQRLEHALSEMYPVDALGCSLVASENVLAPRSQETINLFQRGLQSVKANLPSGAAVLDMGCGCGCLSLLAAQELSELSVSVVATDVLPEAVATTQLNLQRFPQAPVRVMPPGNLFQPVDHLRFELIIFNAPWIVSPARNRAELAIHDEKQRTLKRFFNEVGDHLTENGYILLGYADASGPKAIANLEAMIENAMFVVAERFKARVATHRSKGKWENIMVYVIR